MQISSKGHRLESRQQVSGYRPAACILQNGVNCGVKAEIRMPENAEICGVSDFCQNMGYNRRLMKSITWAVV